MVVPVAQIVMVATRPVVGLAEVPTAVQFVHAPTLVAECR